MARFGSEKIRGHGIPEAIEAILFGKSKMSPKVALLKPLASGDRDRQRRTVRRRRPDHHDRRRDRFAAGAGFPSAGGERKALLVAGAVAGMTAVFGTPVAAVLLAVELLLFELRPRSLLPVAVACAVAGFAAPAAVGHAGPLFPLQTPPVGPHRPCSPVRSPGSPAARCPGRCRRCALRGGRVFGKLPIHWMWWPALGGVVVGIGGYLQPRALGVGYDVIGDLLQNHLALSVGTGAVAGAKR